MELISGKMTRKGQITIPKEIREKLNVGEGDQFKFLISGNNIKIEPVKKKLLSNAVGRVVTNDPIDFKKMRETVQEQTSKKIFYDEIGGHDD